MCLTPSARQIHKRNPDYGFFFDASNGLRLAHKNIMSVTRIYLYSTSLAEGEIFFIQMIQHTSENPRHILHKSIAIVNALPVVCVCVCRWRTPSTHLRLPNSHLLLIRNGN